MVDETLKDRVEVCAYPLRPLFEKKTRNVSSWLSFYVNSQQNIYDRQWYELFYPRIIGFQSAKKYRAAHTLLHSLSEMATLGDDKRILNDYKREVEKRLLYLESQGACITVSWVEYSEAIICLTYSRSRCLQVLKKTCLVWTILPDRQFLFHLYPLHLVII